MHPDGRIETGDGGETGGIQKLILQSIVQIQQQLIKFELLIGINL